MNHKSALVQIAKISPQLKTAYDAELEYWHPESPSLTTLAGTLATAVSLNLADLSDATLADIFAICETALNNGEMDEANAIATGFLEGLQHADSRGDFNFAQVVHYLGQASTAHCKAMDRFHGTSTRGL